MPTAALGSAEPGSARRPPSWASFSVLVASPRRSGFSMCAHPRCRGGSLPTDASDRPACRLASASRPFRRRHVRVPPGSSNYVQVSGVSTMPAWSKRLDLGMALSPTSGVSERFRVPAPARLASWLCTGAAGVPRLAGVFQLHAVDAGRHDLAFCDKYHGSLRFKQFIAEIATDLSEAARVDGTSENRRWRPRRKESRLARWSAAGSPRGTRLLEQWPGATPATRMVLELAGIADPERGGLQVTAAGELRRGLPRSGATRRHTYELESAAPNVAGAAHVGRDSCSGAQSGAGSRSINARRGDCHISADGGCAHRRRRQPL